MLREIIKMLRSGRSDAYIEACMYAKFNDTYSITAIGNMVEKERKKLILANR